LALIKWSLGFDTTPGHETILLGVMAYVFGGKVVSQIKSGNRDVKIEIEKSDKE
jgi:hypothetical protein